MRSCGASGTVPHLPIPERRTADPLGEPTWEGLALVLSSLLSRGSRSNDPGVDILEEPRRGWALWPTGLACIHDRRTPSRLPSSTTRAVIAAPKPRPS